MAENQAKGDQPKKGSKKTMMIIAGVMVLEAVAVGLVVSLAAPRSSSAQIQPEELGVDSPDQIQEIEVLSAKFQNRTTGRLYVWEVSIFIQAKTSNAERIERLLKQRGAEIRQGVGKIIASAQPSHLYEPGLQTLNRKLLVYLRSILDPQGGETVVEKVLIPNWRGFAAD